MTDKLEPISKYLKRLRERAGLSVAQAAMAAEISPPYLYQIEDGRRTPSAKVLARLAPSYRVKLEELLVRAELLPPLTLSSVNGESREEHINRAFGYVMQDPGVRAGSDAMQRLPVEAKLAIVRLYEKAEGLRILPEDVI